MMMMGTSPGQGPALGGSVGVRGFPRRSTAGGATSAASLGAASPFAPQHQHQLQQVQQQQHGVGVGVGMYQPQVPQVAPAAVSEPAFVDPLGRHRGHAIAMFGFGGKLLITTPRRQNRFTVVNGTQTQVEKSYAGPVSIVPVQK
ncbi:hypothetical protein HK102_012805, partial [Quaeritorhiza haematococci]